MGGTRIFFKQPIAPDFVSLALLTTTNLFFPGGGCIMELDSKSDSFIGKTLGNFTLQHVLGRGGMGVVYLAQQSRPRRTVAMKMLTTEIFPNQTAFSEFLVRFRREADAIAAL